MVTKPLLDKDVTLTSYIYLIENYYFLLIKFIQKYNYSVVSFQKYFIYVELAKIYDFIKVFINIPYNYRLY